MLANFWALLAHERNQQQAMQREVQARAQGLPQPERFATQFPGSTNNSTTNINGTPGGVSGVGWLLASTLGAALLGGGGLATWLATGGARAALPQPAPVIVQQENQAPAVKAPCPPPQHWDGVWRQKQPDGTWKEIKRERLK